MDAKKLRLPITPTLLSVAVAIQSSRVGRMKNEEPKPERIQFSLLTLLLLALYLAALAYVHTSLWEIMPLEFWIALWFGVFFGAYFSMEAAIGMKDYGFSPKVAFVVSYVLVAVSVAVFYYLFVSGA
jgi:hypothetical protein